MNKESINYDYKGWDKYSWFLYLSNKKEEAKEANLKAQFAVKECLKREKDEYAAYYLENIKLHEKQIKDNNWMVYLK